MADAADVRREIFISAPPAVVFELLTNSEKLLRWMAVSADVEPVPGGRFRMSPNGRDTVEGTFLEVIPQRRIVFTWGYVGPEARIPAGSSTVEITLRAHRGGTRLWLRHRGLPPGEPRTGHAAGWSHYLARLGATAEGREPGPDSYAAEGVRHG